MDNDNVTYRFISRKVKNGTIQSTSISLQTYLSATLREKKTIETKLYVLQRLNSVTRKCVICFMETLLFLLTDDTLA